MTATSKNTVVGTALDSRLVCLTFCGCIDLELRKVNEDLLHVGSHHLKVFDRVVLHKIGQDAKGGGQGHGTLSSVDSSDTIAYFDRHAGDANDVGSSRSGVYLASSTVEHKFGRWNLFLDKSQNVCGTIIILSAILNQLDRVTESVFGLQVVWRAKDDESAIDHDGNIVTELFGLVHAMSSEQHGCHIHLLDHPIQRTA